MGKLFSKRRSIVKNGIKTSRKLLKAQQDSSDNRENVNCKKYTHIKTIPAYLLERDQSCSDKSVDTLLKHKRSDKISKWNVPINKVQAVSEEDVFVTQGTGKYRKSKWKKVVTKVTFTHPSMTRK